MPSKAKKLTSCYVHQLLDQQRGSGTWTPSLEGMAAHKKADKDPLGMHNSMVSGDGNHHTESRLLTKKQLSDMALGIRELSKKLSHVQLKIRIKNIFILVKAHDESLMIQTRTLAAWLMNKDESFVVYGTSFLFVRCVY
jgi:NAD+ kinase